MLVVCPILSHYNDRLLCFVHQKKQRYIMLLLLCLVHYNRGWGIMLLKCFLYDLCLHNTVNSMFLDLWLKGG